MRSSFSTLPYNLLLQNFWYKNFNNTEYAACLSKGGKDIDGNEVKYRVREELAIAFQHEYDHLNGILFVDYIDPKDPYKNAENMREI